MKIVGLSKLRSAARRSRLWRRTLWRHRHSVAILTLGIVLLDAPRQQVPRGWSSPLMEAGKFFLGVDDDLEIQSITAPIADGRLELIPVAFVSDEGGPRVAELEEIAQHYSGQTHRRVIAGVNGGFFDMQKGLTIGFVMRDGEMTFFNMPQGFRRSMLGIVPSGERPGRLLIASPDEMPKGWLEAFRHDAWISMPVHHVNIPGGRDAFTLFTPAYGKRLNLDTDADYIQVRREGLQEHVVGSFSGRTSVEIPRDGYVVALFGESRGWRSSLPTGTRVRRHFSLPHGWVEAGVRHGLLAGPRLLADGKIRITAREERLNQLTSRDRVAVGTRRDGQVVLLWARRRTGGNLTFEQLAQALQQQGAVEAMGLDGGQSRALLARLQAPDDYISTAGRPIANGILLARVSHSPK